MPGLDDDGEWMGAGQAGCRPTTSRAKRRPRGVLGHVRAHPPLLTRPGTACHLQCGNAAREGWMEALSMKDNPFDDPASGLPLFDDRMRIEDTAAVLGAIAGEIPGAANAAAGRHSGPDSDRAESDSAPLRICLRFKLNSSLDLD